MVSSIKKKFNNFLNHYATVKTRQLLLTLDDQMLEQAGISGDLVRKGVTHWPWHINAATGSQVIASSKPDNDLDSSVSIARPAAATAGASVLADPIVSHPAGEYVVDEARHEAA